MRRNHPKRRERKSNDYSVDFIILPRHPEISHIICEPSRTVYRNMAACEDAPMIPVIHTNDDPAMRLLTGNI